MLSETVTVAYATVAGTATTGVITGAGTGTIRNSDPLQQAWAARFGRTVASQVVEAVSNRLSGERKVNQVTIGGLTTNPQGTLKENDRHPQGE